MAVLPFEVPPIFLEKQLQISGFYKNLLLLVMANILDAVLNVVNNPKVEIQEFYQGNNRANSMGEALEKYIKDIFCDTIELSEKDAMKKYNEVFSYLGNQNNPPDIILKNSDAIEIKKIESPLSALALNSSFPKSKIYANSPMITSACKNCEKWDEKDLLYIIGHTKKQKLKYLWFIYGDIYAAEKETYQKIKTKISEGILSIPNIEFTETKELGKVNRIDPLGITYLRIRGMWGIDNPNKVFNYICKYNPNKGFQLFVLLRTSKFNTLGLKSRNGILKSKNLTVTDVKVKNPNNPAQLIDCKLIKNKI